MRLFRILPVLFLGAVAACSAPPPEDDPPVPRVEPYTYVNDIAPLFARECTRCHTSGGIAPFALETYEDVAPRKETIAIAVRARIMPPFGVDNSGACNTFTDARWLSDEEIDAIETWVTAGAPRGSEVFPYTPAVPRGIQAAVTLDIGATYTPSSELEDDYRCFVVDTGVTDTRYLTGYAVHPGEPRIVHHIILYALAGEDAENAALELDRAEDGPGYTCFGGPGVNDIRFLAGWAPGVSETHYPERTGIEVPAGRRAVMQVHYHGAGERLSDRTTLDLQLAESVELPAIVLPIADLDLALEPGLADQSSSEEATLNDPPAVDVYGVFPHMHRLGRSLRVEQHHAATGETSCLADVPRWSFDWQQFYFYEEPLRVEVGDRVNLTCTFDTSTRSEPITWGEGTNDEMCLAGFYVVRR